MAAAPPLTHPLRLRRRSAPLPAPPAEPHPASVSREPGRGRCHVRARARTQSSPALPLIGRGGGRAPAVGPAPSAHALLPSGCLPPREGRGSARSPSPSAPQLRPAGTTPTGTRCPPTSCLHSNRALGGAWPRGGVPCPAPSLTSACRRCGAGEQWQRAVLTAAGGSREGRPPPPPPPPFWGAPSRGWACEVEGRAPRRESGRGGGVTAGSRGAGPGPAPRAMP